MLKWLNKKQLLGEDSPPLAPDAALLDNWVSPLSAESLLGTPLRQRLIRLIWQRTSIPDHMFRQLILGPIQNFATLVQLLPASQYHHHAYYGGMLDHGLEVAGYSTNTRQTDLYTPRSPP